ncbi:SagB/ThcOx family dehydrogenase [Saccharothrix lopnurensis]|uniref:SagB/ThcOx family dehydrogenase n=1 Tax=Saccharothrix lopnurensis TaxID=1670621 RepID=A0ABW1PAZ8_9PSEU
MRVRLNPAVRMIPPSAVDGARWTAEHLLERKRYTLSTPAAAMLVAACRPQELEELANGMTERGGPSVEWFGLADSLYRRHLVVEVGEIDRDPRLAWLVTLRRDWSRFGWHEAVEYHALAFDYPCVDYSEGVAITTDRDRMRGYQVDEPDTDRFKTTYLDQPGTPLPMPDRKMITTTARALWTNNTNGRKTEFEQLGTALSLAFGVTGRLVPITDSAPLIRRSSPSGGGRNPSEGYVIVRDLAGIEPGVYHITIEPFGLRRLDVPPLTADDLAEIFPETMRRFPFDTRALVVITSLFERNMYRYREPRTFRTVHMDAGHIAGALRIAARSLGLTAGIFYCDAADQVERVLGLDGMEEGYMVTVAVADGAGDTDAGGTAVSA